MDNNAQFIADLEALKNRVKVAEERVEGAQAIAVACFGAACVTLFVAAIAVTRPKFSLTIIDAPLPVPGR